MHFLRACSVLDHRPFRSQIPLKDGNGSLCADGLVIRTDNILSGQMAAVPLIKLSQPFLTPLIISVRLQLLKIFSKGSAGNGHHIKMKMFLNFFHDRRHTACIVKALRRPPAGRPHIQKIMGSPVQAVKGISRNLKAQLMGNGRNMEQAVGGAGNSSVNQNGVFEAFHSNDPAGTHFLLSCHFHRPASCLAGVCQQVRAGSRHQRAARKRQSQSLCHNLHAGSRSDKGAGPAAGAGIMLRPV